MSGRAATNAVIPGRHALSVGNPGTAVPPGWAWLPLGQLAEMGTGHTPSRGVPAYWDGDVPWMGIRDARAHHGGTIWNTTQTITQTGLDNSSARLLPAGTVALSRTASVGYVVQFGRTMATSHDFVTWTCSAALDPRYLMRAIEAEGDDIRAFGEGSTHTTIYFPELKALEIRTPPLPEQCRIVEKISRLSVSSARARDELERSASLIETFKNAVVQNAFRGQLSEPWRLNAGSARALTKSDLAQLRSAAMTGRRSAAGRVRRCVDAVEPTWTPALDLPDGWRWTSVDSITSLIQYGSSAKTDRDASGVPVLRMGNIKNGALDRTELRYLPRDHEEFPSLLLDAGDILSNRTNSLELVGKTAVYEGDIAESFASYLIRLKTVGYDPKLLAYYINSPIGRAWIAEAAAQQVGQANVNGTKLRGLAIPLMPSEEQKEIVSRIERAFAAIDRFAAEAHSARENLKRLDQAILAKAFRGELVPQDSIVDPARVLLERIRADRGAAGPAPKRGRRPRGAAA